MREIKFRVWDSKSEMMSIPFGLGYKTLETKEEEYICESNDLTSGEFRVMQFTGLKDEDGKEIYEGDIVQKGFEKYQIEWQYTSFGINTKNYGWQLLDEFTGIKIIGNIYENPYLLSQSKPVV